MIKFEDIKKPSVKANHIYRRQRNSLCTNKNTEKYSG